MAARKGSQLRASNRVPLPVMISPGEQIPGRSGSGSQNPQQSRGLLAADLFCTQKENEGCASSEPECALAFVGTARLASPVGESRIAEPGADRQHAPALDIGH